LVDVIFRLGLSLADKLIEDRDVFELFDFDLEDVLYLFVRLSRVLGIGVIVPVPVSGFAIFLQDLRRIFFFLGMAVVLPEAIPVFLKVVGFFVLLLFPCFLFFLPRFASVFDSSRSVVLLAPDESEESSKHHVVIPLWLKEHFCILRVQILEERKDLPKTKGDAHPLKLVLEKLCVDLLGEQ